MGCGKTTVGRELHKRTQWPFFDTDQEIETRTGMAIREIFDSFGESAFRDMETALLRELAEYPLDQPLILATGGGILGREENRALLRRIGFVVWLRVTPDTIWDRVSRTRTRPLLQVEDPRQVISNLLDVRTPWYRETAHMVIDTDDLNLDETTFGITESARLFANGLDPYGRQI